MAVTANTPSDFVAQMQDNGIPIELPLGSTFAWSTDDPTDTIVVSDDTATATITVSNPPDTRTTLTVTVSAVDPAGETIEGSVTVDILPGVTHTYTISVSQVTLRGSRGKKKK